MENQIQSETAVGTKKKSKAGLIILCSIAALAAAIVFLTIRPMIITNSDYNEAKQEYLDGKFQKSYELFEKVKDYSDSNDYLKKLDFLIKLNGTWKNVKSDNDYADYVVFDGWNFTDIQNFLYFKKTHIGKNSYSIDDDLKINMNSVKEGDVFEFTYSNDILSEHSAQLTDTGSEYYYDANYRKESDSVSVPEEPAIGMTKDDVLASTWGKPDDINTTTTANGESEQWVYSGNRYIYFDDGIVTSIQQ